MVTSPSVDAGLPLTVGEMIARYHPMSRVCTRVEWAQIADLTKACVSRAGAASEATVAVRLTAVTRFLAWALREGYDLDARSLFIPERVDYFIRVGLTEIGTGSRSTLRSALRVVAKASGRPDHWPESPIRIPHQLISTPYTPAQIDRYLHIADRQHSDLRRRTMWSLLTLGYGAGLRTAEIKTTTAAHVKDADGVLIVNASAPDRQIGVLNTVAPALRDLAATYPSGNLIGLNLQGKGHNALNRRLESLEIPAGVPRLSCARLRATWMVTQLSSEIRISEFMHMAGITSPRVLEELRHHIPMRPAMLALAAGAQR